VERQAGHSEQIVDAGVRRCWRQVDRAWLVIHGPHSRNFLGKS